MFGVLAEAEEDQVIRTDLDNELEGSSPAMLLGGRILNGLLQTPAGSIDRPFRPPCRPTGPL